MNAIDRFAHWYAHGQTASLLARAQALTLLRKEDLQYHVFRNVRSDRWLWYNTGSSRRFSVFRNMLPTLPDEKTQIGFIGSAGDDALGEAFQMYRLFEAMAAKYGRPLHRDSKVLDFGCGWGRILRFFMKDVAARNLMGVDAMPLAIELSKATNPWCTFELVTPFPPTNLTSDTFDLVYLYSVFSHLSEDAHRRWLAEFHRVLKPGGILIATTWPRSYIERCERAREGDTRSTHSGSLLAFIDTQSALMQYDKGLFCHSPVGGGADLSESFYGESCIPARYVKTNWTELFTFREFIEPDGGGQNIAVVQKPV